MVRLRSVGVGLLLGAVCFSNACGRSERDDDDDDGDAGDAGDAGQFTGGTGNRGGTTGRATGGVGGVNCGPACFNGSINLFGPCPGGGFTSCDRSVSGVDCVTEGPCPTITTGGVGGQGGEGGGS
jgi:hypothetical protein